MQKKCIFLQKYLVNSKFYCNFARFFYGRSMFFNMNKLEKARRSRDDGGFVYRLVRQIFILKRGVRLSYPLQNTDLPQKVTHLLNNKKQN